MNFDQFLSVFRIATPAFWEKSGKGDNTLQKVLPQDIDLTKKTILILPGIDHVGSRSTKRTYLDLIRGIIGGDLEVEASIPMYSMTYRNMLENAYDLKRFNSDPSAYCGYLAQRQAKALFDSLVQRQSSDELSGSLHNLTIFASSYGAVFARQMANELGHLLDKAGYDEKQKDALLRQVHLLAVCDVGREDDKCGFTTVSFRGYNDLLVQGQVPEYTSQSRLDPTQTTLVASPDRRITTVYCANPETMTLRRSTGKLIDSPNRHTTAYYAAKKVDAGQNVVPTLIENTLLHMVQRTEPLHDPALLKEPAPFFSKNGEDYAVRKALLMLLPVWEGEIPHSGQQVMFRKIANATSSAVLPQSGTPVPATETRSDADRNAYGSDWRDRSRKSPAPHPGIQ